VDVARSIRLAVMPAMMRGPPERAHLGRAGPGDGERDLDGSRGTERAVREEPVEASGQREGPDDEEQRGDRERDLRDARPDSREGCRVHREQRDASAGFERFPEAWVHRRSRFGPLCRDSMPGTLV
jgi:hypothetical protein